jgi:hypothetical protein
MPVDGAFVVAGVLVTVAAVVRAMGALGDRTGRRPQRELCALLLLMVAIACYALPAGTPHFQDLGASLAAPGRLLSDLLVMAVVYAALALVILPGQPFRQAWPRIAHRLAGFGICAVGMTFAAALVPGPASPVTDSTATSPQELAYFTLQVAFLGTALAELLALSWQQARVSPHRRVTQGGLLLTCAGAGAGLAALAGQVGWAIATAPHMLPPAAPVATSCAGLDGPARYLAPPCAFTVTLPSALVLLAAAGAALPVLLAAAATTWRCWRNLLMYRALEPLWELLLASFPQISLPEHGGHRRLDMGFHLYRRVIEIGDGRLLLRPYMRPEVTAEATEAAARFGLRGDELLATVEATEIVAAIRARRGAVAFDYPPPPDHSEPHVTSLAEEASWLFKVARAYTTSPLVYHLVMHRR